VKNRLISQLEKQVSSQSASFF